MSEQVRVFARSVRVCIAIMASAVLSPALAADWFAPETGSGPAVILLSGASGTQAYRWYAMEVAKLGYTVILVNGSEVCASSSSGCWKNDKESAENLRKMIANAQSDKRVMPGKVSVIGFSLGGGGALAHATSLADWVAGVVAYYPSISKIPDLRATALKVSVPTLVFAGEHDSFKCCQVESMREFELGSRASGNPTELVVYPEADHGFNLDGARYRADYSSDAWEKTSAFLARVQPRK
jgi:dienelactone hydrolase